jgi:hypothetical protein
MENNDTITNTTFPPLLPVEAAVFDVGQKIVFVTSSAACVLFGYLVYRVAKRAIDKDEDYFGRMEWLYAMCTGSLIGALLTDAIPHAGLHSELGVSTGYTSYAVTCFGITIGLLIMLLLQNVSRVWHSNNHYQTPAIVAENQQNLLDTKTLTGNTHLVVDSDLTGDAFGSQYITFMDKSKDWNKRIMFSAILYSCMTFIVIMDGLFIVYWSSRSPAGPWVMIILSWITRLLYSSIVYCALIHGMAHTIETNKWWKYFFKYGSLSFLWFCTLVCSCSFMLSDMSVDTATYVIERVPFSFFYGIVAGILLWQTSYFYWMQPETTTSTSVRSKYLIVLAISLSMCIIGLFL